MSYGVMYDEGGTSVFRLFDHWEEAYQVAFTLGAGVHHNEVALYAMDAFSNLMVRVITL